MHTFIINDASISQAIDEAENFIKEVPFWSVVIYVTVEPNKKFRPEEDTHSLCANLIWKFERELKMKLGKDYYGNRSAEDAWHYVFTFYRFTTTSSSNRML